MIFFGTKGRTIQGPKVTTIHCPSCGNIEHETFGIQRYFHLYWIPTFPTSRTILVSCTNCRHAQEEKDLQPAVVKTINETVFNAKQLIPLFSGAFLIACLITWVSYTGIQTQAREAQYIDAPHVADLYVANLSRIFDGIDSDYPYGVLRVVATSEDGVECVIGTVSYSQSSGPGGDIDKKKTDSDEYYGEETVMFGLAELKELKSISAITRVERREEL